MFIVEDGSGKPDSNAYITVEFASEYFTTRGNATWAAKSQQEQEAAIIRATDYIDARFGQSFIGIRSFQNQSLQWPRKEIIDIKFNEIPRLLQRACAEYAIRALDGDLLPDPTYNVNAGALIYERDRAGPVEEERRYAEGTASMSLFQPYPAADILLQPLLQVVSGLIRN